jgi:hypothetical protein
MTLKTRTLHRESDPDNPAIVVCDGHVTADEFNKAFKAEGWDRESDYTQEDLTHGYSAFQANGFERVTTQNIKGTKPVTYVHWDS